MSICRIERESTTQCHYCGRDQASAESEILVIRIERDLSPPAIVTAVLEDQESQEKVLSFYEAVMLQKEVGMVYLKVRKNVIIVHVVARRC